MASWESVLSLWLLLVLSRLIMQKNSMITTDDTPVCTAYSLGYEITDRMAHLQTGRNDLPNKTYGQGYFLHGQS